VDNTTLSTLFEISSTGRRLRQMEAERTSLVRRARRQGASWAQIARHLGVTPQAAYKRFGRGSA
jgi:transposase-like protein